jgi:hypothetical protein
VRCVGRFLGRPLDGVPTELVDYLAEQLGIEDPSCVKSGRIVSPRQRYVGAYTASVQIPPAGTLILRVCKANDRF